MAGVDNASGTHNPLSELISATPIRRRPFGDAVSATGRFGDRQFGDETFRRPPVRRWDVSATGRFGDGRFGDQSSTVFMCSNNDYNQFVNVS